VVERDFPDSHAVHLFVRQRSQVAMPLLREGEAIGVLGVFRWELRPFTEQQIALLETFADQAVIAIENARLFEELERRTGELTRALEQQTAVGEVLRVIASSPTEAGSVLETIARSAMQLSGSTRAALLVREGDQLVRRASIGEEVEIWPVGECISLTARRDAVAAVLECRTIHTPDRSDPAFHAEFPDTTLRIAVATVVVPLLRESEALGLLVVGRDIARGYSPSEISLVETFADQAVIAIENARLFEELERRNGELRAALATSVFRTVWRSVGDEAITRRISLVAICWSSASPRS